MTISNICKTILRHSSSRNNIINSDAKEMDITILFGNPGFGKTTLLLQIAHEISQSGEVLFLSLEHCKKQIIDRLQRMNMLSKYIFIDDNFQISIEYVQRLIDHHKNTKLIIIDYLQLTEGINFLLELYERIRIPILISSQIGRFANDNPFGLTTYTDIIYQLLQQEKITPTILKGIKKLCINRIHKCDRNIGTAHTYDVSNDTSVEEYDNNGFVRRYKLKWDSDKCQFVNRQSH